MHRSFYWKKSLELTTHLLNSTENDLKFCKLKIIFQPPDKRNSLFRYKYSLRKRFALTLFTDTRAVPARLLAIVKHNATFLIDLQSMRVYQI